RQRQHVLSRDPLRAPAGGDERDGFHAAAGSCVKYTVFQSEYRSSASVPGSRQPVLEFFSPPNGTCGSKPYVGPFTWTPPATTRCANAWPRWMLSVQIAAVNPYGDAFATASASSKPATRCSVAIGPKSSVHESSASAATPSTIVGAT